MTKEERAAKVAEITARHEKYNREVVFAGKWWSDASGGHHDRDTLLAIVAELEVENIKLHKAFKKAISFSLSACLVPPDGGSPSSEETELCEYISNYINDIYKEIKL